MPPAAMSGRRLFPAGGHCYPGMNGLGRPNDDRSGREQAHCWTLIVRDF
jgi:hypothetical protein